MDKLNKKKDNNKNNLQKLNFRITIWVIIVNVVLFFLSDKEKSNFIILSVYSNIFLLFIYSFLLNSLLRRDIIAIKREALSFNHIANVLTFMFFFLLLIIGSGIYLTVVNNEVADIALIFTFFVTVISLLIPSIALLATILLLFPSVVIPALKRNKLMNNIVLKAIFVGFILLFSYNSINWITSGLYMESHDKFESDRVIVKYSTKYLKFKGISESTEKNLLNMTDIRVPLFHTKKSFKYNSYQNAEKFCNSLDAAIPDYMQIYHIVFNKFDIFGEKYFWTNETDGDTPLVLHFKNSSFEIIKKPDNVKPLLYCVADVPEDSISEHISYFYKNDKKEIVRKQAEAAKQERLKNNKQANLQKETSEKKNIPDKSSTEGEKRHVNFSVKMVPLEYFDELKSKGYVYDNKIVADSRYEANESSFAKAINRDNKKSIRLCYFPFTEYNDLTIDQEKEIWQQSFCSPSFELVNEIPVLKTKNTKDSYCLASGGHLPNIPELVGILKTLKINQTGLQYWVNTKVSSENSDFKQSVLVYFKNQRFLDVVLADENNTEHAYVFCIKDSKKPSSVIANYKSRFNGANGYYYAKKKCPKCEYYELPDTVLKQ